MTNFEKYKTAEERYKSFNDFCNGDCKNCKLITLLENGVSCEFGWLDLEAEDEKPLPCPFCSGETKLAVQKDSYNRFYVACSICEYSTGHCFNAKEEAIAAHNSVAKAVKDANEN